MAHSPKDKTCIFRELNERGELLLPNAWDAASARIFEDAGFPAIGTTSAGVSYTLGMKDGEAMNRAVSVHQSSIIAKAVSVPVTADIEAGYGASADAVSETIAAVLNAEIVGVNLEDNTHHNALFNIADQAKRIAAARNEANKHGIDLTINARTDTFLVGLGADDNDRIAMTIERGQAYIEAGADMVFVPLVVDLEIIAQLASAFDGKLNVMAMPGAPSAPQMFKAGAKRVSIGQTAMLSALGHVANIAKEMKSGGTWQEIEQTFFGFAEGEDLFSSKSTE